MSNLASPLLCLNKPILDFQNISEFCDDNRNDTSRHVVIDKLNLKVKKGELVTNVPPSRSGKSTLLNIVDGLDVPRPRNIDHRLVESISKEIKLVSEGLFCNDRESTLIKEVNGLILPGLSPNSLC